MIFIVHLYRHQVPFFFFNKTTSIRRRGDVCTRFIKKYWTLSDSEEIYASLQLAVTCVSENAENLCLFSGFLCRGTTLIYWIVILQWQPAGRSVFSKNVFIVSFMFQLFFFFTVKGLFSRVSQKVEDKNRSRNDQGWKVSQHNTLSAAACVY